MPNSNFQDDGREEKMRQLFNLKKDSNEGRSGIDAYMEVGSQVLDFELKTTSTGSVTTVRDFGYSHIKKWATKHWLIGFFIGGEEYYKYASPNKMATWISEKEEYIRTDFFLVDILPSRLIMDDVFKILPKKKKYLLSDALKIQKRQYTKAKYIELQDLQDGYSPKRMLEILQDRAGYLISRGSTLNNPHIPKGYFNDCKKITSNHSAELLTLVNEYLELNQ